MSCAGVWELRDTVADYPEFQEWKFATRQLNGKWTYEFGSTAGKTEMVVGVDRTRLFLQNVKSDH